MALRAVFDGFLEDPPDACLEICDPAEEWGEGFGRWADFPMKMGVMIFSPPALMKVSEAVEARWGLLRRVERVKMSSRERLSSLRSAIKSASWSYR